MTEAEWLACDEPELMLRHLRPRKRKPSDRKLRLFIAALWRRFHTDADREKYGSPEHFDKMAVALEAAERMADEARPDYPFYSSWVFTNPSLRWGVRQSLESSPLCDAVPASFQASLLRDVIGNPFHPASLDPTWRTPDVLTLAHSAYDERLLPAGELDPPRLQVLADALEDAGCSDAVILEHLRGPGPHVRGCWVVDLLLARG